MHISDDNKIKLLVEAYNKHSRELLSLEESQQRLVTLLLAVLAAGITFIAEIQPFPQQLMIPLIIVAILLAVFGGVYTHKRNKARASIRRLMVAIEEAMGFYDQNQYLQGRSLYPAAMKTYPKAQWLGSIYYIVLLAAISFIFIVLWRGMGSL